jgi:two-component system sensor histidine kinase CreC
MAKDLRTRYHEGFEDPLVDVANILAAMVGTEMEMGRFDPKNLYLAFQHVRENFIAAKVYDLLKTDVDAEVYITDASGKVLFDSQDRQNIGTDYSNWRDVRLTLQGQYGARATRRDPNDPYSVVLYVAAPIIVQGKTVGVLTVGKPTTDVNGFVKMARPRIIDIWLLSSAAAILLSFVVSSWITVQIRRLTQYAHDVREGKKARLPELGRSELSEMAMAFETMRGRRSRGESMPNSTCRPSRTRSRARFPPFKERPNFCKRRCRLGPAPDFYRTSAAKPIGLANWSTGC